MPRFWRVVCDGLASKLTDSKAHAESHAELMRVSVSAPAVVQEVKFDGRVVLPDPIKVYKCLCGKGSPVIVHAYLIEQRSSWRIYVTEEGCLWKENGAHWHSDPQEAVAAEFDLFAYKLIQAIHGIKPGTFTPEANRIRNYMTQLGKLLLKAGIDGFQVSSQPFRP